MSLSSSPTTTMKQILGIAKLIPVYQRNFVWDKDLRTGFFEDLMEAYESGEEYFIGSMVLRENGKQFEIVDGQQRITSLFLLVSSAVKLAETYDEYGDFADLFSQYRSVLFSARRDSRGGGVVHVPSLRHADKLINKAYVAISTGQTDFCTETDGIMVQNLDAAQVDAIKALEDFLSDKLNKPDEIASLLDYIDEKVICIHHVAKTIETALTIYSRLNSTGKTLTKFEILKGMSFQEAEKANLWDDIDERWTELEDLLSSKVQLGGKGQRKELIKDDTLLSYKLFIDMPHIGQNLPLHGDAWVGGDKLAKVLFENDLKSVLSSDPVGFVSAITSFVNEIRKLRVATGILNEKVRNYLIDIASAAGTQTQWLMVAIPLNRHFPESELAFRTLRNMVLVFSLALTGSGSSSAIYKKLSAKLSKAHNGHPPSEDQLSEVINLMNQELLDRWSDYEYAVTSLRYARRSDRRVLRDIFELIEVELNHEFNVGQHKNLNDFLFARKVNLDHLQPQSSQQFSDEYLHQIGNLCLLTEPANKGLRDLPFEDTDKQETIGQSEFWATRALGSGTYFGAEKRALSSFSSRTSLNEEDICDRTKEILGFLKQQLTR